MEKYVNKLSRADLDNELAKRGLSPQGNARKRNKWLLSVLVVEDSVEDGEKSDNLTKSDSENDPQTSENTDETRPEARGVDKSRFELLEQNVAEMKENFDEQTSKILKMLNDIAIRKDKSENFEHNFDDGILDSDNQDGADDKGSVKLTNDDVKMDRFYSESSTNKEFKHLTRKFELHSQVLHTEIDDIKNAIKDDENDCTVKVNIRRLEKEAEKCELIIDKMIEIQDEYPTEIDEILKQWNETRQDFRKAERDAEEYLKKCRVKDRADERKQDNVKLPNYKVPEFHGNILQWPSWIQSFTRVIDNNKDLNISAKYEYLMDRLKGEAKEAVRGFGGDEKNYSKVMETLKSRYGDERLITKRYLESILATKEVEKKSVTSIRTLYNHLSNAYGTLESYNITKESFYLAMFEKTLPPELKQEWEKRHSHIRRDRSENGPVTVEDFFDFLLDEVKSLEATEKINPSTDKKERKSPHPRVRNHRDSKESHYTYEDLPSSGQALLTKSVPTKKCIFCQKTGHSSVKCYEAQKIDIDERWKIVSAAKVCFNCLLPMGRDHNSSSCKAPTCNQSGCTGKHATILHKERAVKNHVTSNLTSGCTTTERQKLCPLAMGTLIYEDKELPVRVLLDSGSKDTYVLNNIAESLNMEKIHPVAVLNTTGFGGVSVPQQTKRVKFSLSKQHRQAGDEVIEVEAWTTKKICNPVDPIDIDFKQFDKLKGLKLADDCPRGAMTVDVLIGIDYLDCFLGNNKFKVAEKLYTQESVFGWIVRGVVPKVHAGDTLTVDQTHTQTLLVDTHDINEQLKAFWELETIGILPQVSNLKADEQEAIRQFDEKLKFNENAGRYEVGLLWKPTHPELSDNYDQALKRLESVERMLRKNSDKCEMYCESMNSYIDKGHAREVKKDENATTVHYLPHHPVFRQDKVTSKCRIVFDASAKTKDGVSLNDCLLEGPNILPDMTQVLMRFRCNRIGLASDIKSMFLQIMLQEQDQQVHRFLWREMNTDIEPKVYCKTRVTFGVKSSPFESEATVHKHVEHCQKDFPLAAAEVKENMYMDDYVGGADTPQEAIELQRDMTEMMKLGAFTLTKWASNSDDVLRQIPEDEINPQLIIDFDSTDYETPNTDSTTLKTLGIVWDTSDDCLLFKPPPRKMHDLNTETKRTLLSKVATTFDPLGFYAPFTVRAKKLIQDTWIKGLQWDEPLPPDIGKDFDKWKLEHEQLNTIRLPRCFKDGLSNIIDAQLHGFSDASERCFGGAIYLRLKDDRDNVHLVMSKSRLAPVKKLTIPKLELCGALVMIRLMLFVKKALHFEVSLTACWTDSMIVLCWVQKHASF